MAKGTTFFMLAQMKPTTHDGKTYYAGNGSRPLKYCSNPPTDTYAGIYEEGTIAWHW